MEPRHPSFPWRELGEIAQDAGDFEAATKAFGRGWGCRGEAEDAAGSLAALLTYYGFLSLFPLMLVLITILGLVATPEMAQRVVHSVLAQFPIVGDQLAGPDGIH